MENKKSFFSIFFYIWISQFFLLLNISAVEVTSCKKYGEKYEIVFNNLFSIRNIHYKNYINLGYDKFGTKRYKNVFIYSKKAYIEIENAIKNCDEYRNLENSKKVDYYIFEFEKLNSPKRIANVVVNFDGDLNILFGIVKKNNFYILYPSENFSFIDKSFEKELKSYIVNFIREKEIEWK